MKALISPNESVSYVSSWVWEKVKTPYGEEVYAWVAKLSVLEGAQRVAEVEENTFEIAVPLFWVDCDDNCVADQWYYKDGLFSLVPNVPAPTEPPVEA
jgi:hypothetical protein